MHLFMGIFVVFFSHSCSLACTGACPINAAANVTTRVFEDQLLQAYNCKISILKEKLYLLSESRVIILAGSFQKEDL